MNSAPEATIFIMSLFVTFGIGYHLSKHYGVEELHGALIATASFLIITPFQLEEEEITGVIPVASIGAEGMFAAIIVGFIASEIYRKTIQKNWVITMPQGVPEAVAKSFSTLIPATITLSSFMFINLIFSITPWGDIHNFIYSILQAPLLALGSGLTATLVAVFFTQIFWFFGLHGQILVNSVMEPIWQTLSLENLRAYQNNEPLPHIVNSGFIDTFTVGTGGTGMTLGVLILILIIGRSRQLKQLGKLATPAGIFNVNEPIIFGLPIVLNPLVVIPWILAPMVATTFSYLLMANGVATTNGSKCSLDDPHGNKRRFSYWFNSWGDFANC
nr:PTS transporter subunit EIIC [Sinobaca sp. H24]